MKLSYAVQSRGARSPNKGKTGGPGEEHFIAAAALIIQVKGETQFLSQASCLYDILCSHKEEDDAVLINSSSLFMILALF